jgi:aminotransferase EvaB
MTGGSVPFWSYDAEYTELREEILAACERVFRSGRLILGEEGKRLESAIAEKAGVRGGVGVNSGTDAIVIALSALGIERGDEVITVPNTAVPTVSAIVTIGAKPVLVDVNEHCLMDASKVEAAITPRTKAIVPVHLYGQCVDMDPLLGLARRRGLAVLEDNAQAQGATYKGRPAGSMGDAATLSFYPTKVLGAYGDGGMVLSNDEKVLARATTLRYYGMETTYYSERHGYNSRLDELQAAILSTKLPYMDRWIARRREIAARYTEGLRNSGAIPVAECAYGQHAYHLYVVQHRERDRVIEQLAARGIGTGVQYRWPVHVMRGFAHLGYKEGDFPVAEKKAKEILSLPLYPHLSDAQVDAVIAAVREVA